MWGHLLHGFVGGHWPGVGLVVRRCPGVGPVERRGWPGLGGGQQLEEAVVRSGGATSPAVKHEFNNLGFNDPWIQQSWIQQSWIQRPSHSTILGFNKLRFNDPHIQQYLVSTTLGFNNLEFNNLGFNNPWIQQS